jgi:hypothetical protein
VLLLDPVSDRQRRPDRALGVVLVRDWRPEQSHHRVAAELLDRAAETLKLLAHLAVVARQQCLQVLGIKYLALRGGAHQVAEQCRHDLALVSRGRRLLQWRGACPTKAKPSGFSCPQRGQTITS